MCPSLQPADGKTPEQQLAELEQRLDAGYPPFSYLAALHFSGNSLPAVEEQAKKTAALLRRIKSKAGLRLDILGPSSAPLGRIRGRHRWHILLKATGRGALHAALKQLNTELAPSATVRMAIDIDPLEML